MNKQNPMSSTSNQHEIELMYETPDEGSSIITCLLPFEVKRVRKDISLVWRKQKKIKFDVLNC